MPPAISGSGIETINLLYAKPHPKKGTSHNNILVIWKLDQPVKKATNCGVPAPSLYKAIATGKATIGPDGIREPIAAAINIPINPESKPIQLEINSSGSNTVMKPAAKRDKGNLGKIIINWSRDILRAAGIFFYYLKIQLTKEQLQLTKLL